MTNDDRPAFSAMLALCAEQYGKPMSPELIGLYFDGLAHLPLDTVRAALSKHLRDTDVGHFMPKIADVIRACDGRSEDAAYAALLELQDAFGSVGAWSSVEFADPITRAVVRDMGGWPEICSRSAEEWVRFGARDFMRRYAIYKARGDWNAPGYLPGYFERSPHGTTERPVKIGTDRATLKLVPAKNAEIAHK
jgi:hypothetical protein